VYRESGPSWRRGDVRTVGHAMSAFDPKPTSTSGTLGSVNRRRPGVRIETLPAPLDDERGLRPWPTSPAVCHPGRAIRRSPPCETGKRAHGHPRTTPGLSLDRPAPGTASRPRGWTGRDGNRCCCSGCRRCSCCGWPSGGSPVCCSRSRRAAHAGRLKARSPTKDDTGDDPGAQTPSIRMHGVTDPALQRRLNVHQVDQPGGVGTGESAHPAVKAVAVVVAQAPMVGKHQIPETPKSPDLWVMA
jgi:hypothetical protein